MWELLLTTVGLVRVVATVVHAVTLPLEGHTHSIGTLEVVAVTCFLKLRVSCCGREENKSTHYKTLHWRSIQSPRLGLSIDSKMESYYERNYVHILAEIL